MKLFNTDEDDRGQVGIGTLIVFIAMVLVAAIAAGVLINTAGFLQTQAEDTGTESTEQVADNLNVITQVGNVSDDDKINEVRLGVQPASGANDINLAKLTIQYVSDSDFANIVVGNDTEDGDDTATGDSDPADIVAHNDTQAGQDYVRSSGDERYAINVVTAENEDDVVMTDGADRYEIVIPLNETAISKDAAVAAFNGDLDKLDEGEELELRITTEVGSQTVAFLQVPDSLSGDDAGSTVNL
jgi:flagellin FlaB